MSFDRATRDRLVRALATGAWDGFLPLASGLRVMSGIRFVLTLDSDTGLPTGALREPVANGHHPLNEPKIGAKASRGGGGSGSRRRRRSGKGARRRRRRVKPWTHDGRGSPRSPGVQKGKGAKA